MPTYSIWRGSRGAGTRLSCRKGSRVIILPNANTCQGIVVNVVCCLPGRTTILILYGSYRQVTSRQLATMVIDPLYRDIDYRAIIPEQ